MTKILQVCHFKGFLYQLQPRSEWDTIQLVIFVHLIFCGLGSADNFVGLYFLGIPPLITS